MLSLSEKILLAKYMYKQGIDYISDQEYDALLTQLPENHVALYTRWDEITYEDIEYLLQRENINIDSYVQKLKPKSQEQETTISSSNVGENIGDIKVQDLMNRFPAPSSMQMTTSYDTLYHNYVPQILSLLDGGPADLFQSYKMDGWNITCYYMTGTDGNVILAHTRGRTTTDVTVCTDLMRYLTPNLKQVLDGYTYQTIIRITGEVVLRHDGLPILREAYPNKSFSNVRNSVSAFVHGSIDINKYHNMVSYYAYSFYDMTGGGCPFQRASQLYQWLGSVGFHVPPCAKLTVSGYNTIESTLDAYYESFEKYYKEEFSKYFECDGIVLQPDILNLNDQIQQVSAGNFGDGLIAVKARYWAEKVYTAVVDEIIYPKARASRSVMALVKPVQTALGQTVRRVPLINIQRACIENDVHVGDTIEFIYHSNQLPFFTRNLSHIQRTGGSVSEC